MHINTVSGWCGPLHSDLAASWAEAIGTDVGVLIGIAGLLFVIKTWRSTRGQLQTARAQLAIERDRDGHEKDMARRDQADQIAGWMNRPPGGDHDQRDVYVVNTSRQPIYQVRVHLQAGSNTWERRWMVALGPLIPGQPLILLFGVDPPEMVRIRTARDNNEPFGVCFTFKDVHGQDWTRRWDGELVPGYEWFIPLPGEPRPSISSRSNTVH